MLLKSIIITDFSLRDGEVAGRYSFIANRLPVARDEWMPLGQFMSFSQESIGTAVWHPVQLLQIVGCQLQALWDEPSALAIFTTAAAIQIEVAADDTGIVDLTTLLILQLDQTAACAAITEVLPLFAGERGKGLLPEWRFF